MSDLRTSGFVLSGDEAASRLNIARAALGGQRLGGVSMFDPSVISFAHGEGLRRPHPVAIAGGMHALLDTRDASLEDYMFMNRLAELDEAIASCMLEEGHPETGPDEIIVEAGSTRLAFAALLTLAASGECVLAAPGYYHPLNSWIQHCKLQLGVSALDKLSPGVLTEGVLDQWGSDVARGSLPKPSIIFLFNPTMLGTVYSDDDLFAVGRWAKRWNAIVIEDRSFARTMYPDFSASARVHPFRAVDPNVPSLCLHSVTKAECLANLRFGWAVAEPGLARRVREFSTSTGASVSRISQIVATVALRAPKTFIQENAAEAQLRSELVLKLLASAQLDSEYELRPIVRPSAGHSVYVQAVRLKRGHETAVAGISSIAICEMLLDSSQVAVSPGLSSGFDGSVFRLSFGCLGHGVAADLATERELKQASSYLRQRRKRDVQLRDLNASGSDGDKYANESGDWRRFGRELVREGIEDRLVPGMDSFLRSIIACAGAS